MTPHAFAQTVDHTLLKAEASLAQIKTLCEEANAFGFFSVCLNPVYVRPAQKFLNHSSVKICTVVGFPLGATTSEAKAFETRLAIEAGADEIDMVIAIGAIKSQNWSYVADDVAAVVQAARGQTVKVILETALLTDAEKVRACDISQKAGAAFVKTSTGFSAAGATVADVQLMRKTVGKNGGVKASGGIRDFATAKAMLEAGANRLGLSATVAILNEAKQFWKTT